MNILYLAGDWIRQRQRERLIALGTLAPHRAHGARGEDLAHRYLQRQGMRVIGRNWRTRSATAEIDIIAWDGPSDDGVLAFVEVKTRTSDDSGAPEREIDTIKRRNMARGAGEFVRRFAPKQERIRFDVVSIVLRAPPEIRHVRDAFYVKGLENRQVEAEPDTTPVAVGAGR